MEPVELSRIVEQMGGQWVGTATPPKTLVAEVSTDSRGLTGQPLFFALKGERFDGHRYVEAARKNGAVACVVASSELSRLPRDSGPYVSVPDPLDALERLARWNRDRLDMKVVAITGSVGKTSTKEFVASVLRERFQVSQAPKSYNNRLGVALTLLSAGAHTEVLVTELGTSGPGELAALSRLVRPDHVVVTEIAPAHLDGLNDLAGVLAAKSEIFTGLKPGGTTFLRHGVFGFNTLCSLAKGEVRTFGWGEGDLRVSSCQRVSLGDVRSTTGAKAYGYHFTLNESENFLLPLPGRHNVINAVAAMAVAREFGLTTNELRAALTTCRLPPLRLEVVEVKGIVMINDSYNANPRSVESAIEEWIELTQEPIGGSISTRLSSGDVAPRSGIVVLGDMLELGSKSRLLHEQIGRRLAKQNLRLLVTVGDESRAIQDGYRAAGGKAIGRHFPRVEDVTRFLRGQIYPGDVLLFKGSRRIGVESCFKDLARWTKLFGPRLPSLHVQVGETPAQLGASITNYG